MEWLRISTSTELVRVLTDDIVFVHADGNYSDVLLYNGKKHTMTFQLHFLTFAANIYKKALNLIVNHLIESLYNN